MSVQNGIFAEQPIGVPPTGLKRLARVAGVFYFAIGVTGGFSEDFMDPVRELVKAGTTTVDHLVANQWACNHGSCRSMSRR